jgi:hypothetical protein
LFCKVYALENTSKCIAELEISIQKYSVQSADARRKSICDDPQVSCFWRKRADELESLNTELEQKLNVQLKYRDDLKVQSQMLDRQGEEDQKVLIEKNLVGEICVKFSVFFLHFQTCKPTFEPFCCDGRRALFGFRC